MITLLTVLFKKVYLWTLPGVNYIFMIWLFGFYNILEIIYFYFIIINHYTGIFTYLYLFYLSIRRYINLSVLKTFIIEFLKLCFFMPFILYILKNGNIYNLDTLYIELTNRVDLLDFLRNPEVIEVKNQSDLIEDVKDIRGLVIDGNADDSGGADVSGDADDSDKKGWRPELADCLILITCGFILIGYFSTD
nr:hypothetical protein [Solanum melongena]WMB97178.1 hypothetical protein [Solanum aethiopicum]